jgi:small-conductance mechanosensitive channel
LRHDLIAIKQSLGAVDLSSPLEQLALQLGEEDFMTDTDIGALRVRIAEVETRRNTRAGLAELHAHLDRINSRHDSALAQLQNQLDTLQQTLATSITKRHGRLVATVRRLLSTNKSPHEKKNSLSEARRRDQGIASATKKSI